MTASACSKLINDDFTSIKALVDTYHNDLDGFTSYLKGINKTYGARSTCPIRFRPIIMKRLVAILFHFIQAVRCFHLILNTANIDADTCSVLIAVHEAHTSWKDSDGDDDLSSLSSKGTPTGLYIVTNSSLTSQT